MLPVQKNILSIALNKAITATLAMVKQISPATSHINLQPQDIPEIVFGAPKTVNHGDYASAIAMQLAKQLNIDSKKLAAQLQLYLEDDLSINNIVERIEVAGPGFLNFYLTNKSKQAAVTEILLTKENYGKTKISTQKQVIIEFVSANPTGPLHVGHGRQAALGDVLANILTSQGWKVHREFYYNDAGAQIHNLALSVQARCYKLTTEDASWPKSAYNGEYISEIAQHFLSAKNLGDPSNLNAIRQFAVTYLRREQDLDLQSFGVKFDGYALESSLYTEGKVDKVVELLNSNGKSYIKDNALWLRSTDYGDDKDRVMRKSDGSYTYFVPDVAYHLDKWQRGFTKAVNIQGSDHHGTTARVRAGLQGLDLGIFPNYPEYIFHKMVTVLKNGVEVKISKRAGSYVTLRDLITWSSAEDSSLVKGKDAVRFFLVSRKADTEFVFDIDLAQLQNDTNPVYYIQYAHARICSIFKQWNGDVNTLINADLTTLISTTALNLLKNIAYFPEMLATAGEQLSPHTVAFYLRKLAGDFHSFYNFERVLVEEENVKHARLALLAAVRQVLLNGLNILGVSAPSNM